MKHTVETTDEAGIAHRMYEVMRRRRDLELRGAGEEEIRIAKRGKGSDDDGAALIEARVARTTYQRSHGLWTWSNGQLVRAGAEGWES